MTAAPDEARLAQHWFENTLLPSLKAAENPFHWLAENKDDLVRVDRYVPDGILTIRGVIAARTEAHEP